MIISNKLESIRMVKNLKLNTFPEKVFRTGEEASILDFLTQYPATYYAVRSKEFAGCRDNDFKIDRSRVLEKIRNFRNNPDQHFFKYNNFNTFGKVLFNILEIWYDINEFVKRGGENDIIKK